MNSKQVIATNQTVKQMFKREQDFERTLLTSDLDLALDDNRKKKKKVWPKSKIVERLRPVI